MSLLLIGVSQIFLLQSNSCKNTYSFIMIAYQLTPTRPSPRKSEPDTSADEAEPTLSPSNCKPTSTIPHTSRKESKIKSSLCKNFMLHGFCPYGEKCQFAHGPEELRCNAISNTSYKTKPCFSYLNKGFCPYGHRCNFIHIHTDRQKVSWKQQVLSNFPQLVA